MPIEGNSKFNDLKKAYAKGIELRGKKIGVIGFGRIGRETAKVALGLGMEVLAYDIFEVPNELELIIGANTKVNCPINVVSIDQLIKDADFISLHVPFSEKPVLGKDEFENMKNGVGVVNCSRGGTIDEDALIEALNSGKVAFAGLDVFDNEPTPRQDLLSHPKVSLTPHIGASTNEAQERIGTELANLIIDFFKTV
jgi:D-3-phosphoglycerate dehydrogenase